MVNGLTVAKKEFVDLISNRMVLIVLAIFLIYVTSFIYDFYSTLSGWRPGQVMFNDNVGIAADNVIFYVLTWLGTIVGIIIGCSAISSERTGGTLNTLITKPLYRVTIINGKVLGSIVFLTSVILFFITVATAEFLILCGNALAPHIFDYFSRLPFVFLFIMVYIMVFVSLSMFISLLVKDQAYAMILSTMVVYVTLIMNFPDMAALDGLLPGLNLGSLCVSLSLYSLLDQVQPMLMDTSVEAQLAFANIIPDFTKLVIFVFVVMMLNYIIFVRRDIT